MSRRHLTLAFVALTSLVVTACSSNPTAPETRLKASVRTTADSLAAVTDSVRRSGWAGGSI